MIKSMSRAETRKKQKHAFEFALSILSLVKKEIYYNDLNDFTASQFIKSTLRYSNLFIYVCKVCDAWYAHGG